MITKDEIQELLHSTETYRVEHTTSTGDMDKFQKTICAFANDLPNSRKKGYLILGAYDNGGSVVGKDVGKVGGKNGGKNGGDNVPSFVPSFVPSCYKSVISLSQVGRTRLQPQSQRLQVLAKRLQPLSKKMQPPAIYILEYCDTWRSMDEIAQFSNRDKNYIRKRYYPSLQRNWKKNRISRHSKTSSAEVSHQAKR